MKLAYSDFSKAFDSVFHRILLEKLQPVAWEGTLLGKELAGGPDPEDGRVVVRLGLASSPV